MYQCLEPLDREERVKLLDTILKPSNKTNHESIAKLIIDICFAK
jgi:hypothetical protein